MTAAELIRACTESDDGAAWEEFVARFQRPIALSIRRTATQWGKDPSQFVDDLLQETYLKLCSAKCTALLEFACHHSCEAVLAYIKTIAANVAHDHFKSLHSRKRGAGETDQLMENVDPAGQTGTFGDVQAMDQKVFLKQVDGQLEKCAAGSNQDRDCLIFWFYYLQGMSAKAISALATIKLTPKGAEAVIFRLTRCVREQLGNRAVPDSVGP